VEINQSPISVQGNHKESTEDVRENETNYTMCTEIVNDNAKEATGDDSTTEEKADTMSVADASSVMQIQRIVLASMKVVTQSLIYQMIYYKVLLKQH
jgi:hypothetical protein